MTTTFFKDLTKKEKKHLREMGITTLRQFRKNAEVQARLRGAYPDASEPCWDCRMIARKLEIAV